MKTSICMVLDYSLFVLDPTIWMAQIFNYAYAMGTLWVLTFGMEWARLGIGQDQGKSITDLSRTHFTRYQTCP